MNPNCSSWNCWTPGERTGTAIAITFFIVGVIALLWLGFRSKLPKRGRASMHDLESGRAGSRPRHVRSRRSSRTRSPTSLSYTSSASSSRESRRPKYQSYVRTRSRSRARASEEPRKNIYGYEHQVQHTSLKSGPHHGTHIRDYELPVTAGLAAAAALGAVAEGRRSSTPAPLRSSFSENSTSRGRQLSGGARGRVGDRSRRNTTTDHPRARR